MFQTNRLEKSILLIYKEPWKWISSTQSIEWTSYIQWKVVIIIFIPHLGAIPILCKHFYRLVQHRMFSILLCVSL